MHEELTPLATVSAKPGDQFTGQQFLACDRLSVLIVDDLQRRGVDVNLRRMRCGFLAGKKPAPRFVTVQQRPVTVIPQPEVNRLVAGVP